MLFQLNPSSSMIINRARLTSAAGETRDRVNDTNARRSSLVRLKTDCMLHILLLKSMLHNTSFCRTFNRKNPMATTRTVKVRVNGVAYEQTVEARKTLVDFLREDLGLTGTNVGCEHGVCGACTILMNGEAVRSCIMLAAQADGAELMTVEGLAKPGGELHPIQESFRDKHGLQCGFCTPGVLMTTYELLNKYPDADEEEIKEWLSGHLCRCTGYQDILESVKLAASRLRNR